MAHGPQPVFVFTWVHYSLKYQPWTHILLEPLGMVIRVSPSFLNGLVGLVVFVQPTHALSASGHKVLHSARGPDRSVLRSAESVESWPGAGPGLPVCTSPRGVPHTTKAVKDRRLLITRAAASGGCDRPTQAPPDASSIGHDASWNHRRRQSPDLQSRDSSQG